MLGNGWIGGGSVVRKCRLCGSVIRRRAEYCRFCSARQDGTAPEATGLGTSIAVTAPSAPTDDQWVFEDRVPREPRDAPPPPPGHFPSTLEPRVRLDPPLPDPVQGSNGDGHATPARGPDDALLGFEHFPEAVPVPEVRWG